MIVFKFQHNVAFHENNMGKVHVYLLLFVIYLSFLYSLIKKEENAMETVKQCTINDGGLDSFLLDFEKFASEQEVNIPFFSQRNDFSKSIFPFSV